MRLEERGIDHEHKSVSVGRVDGMLNEMVFHCSGRTETRKDRKIER
jgi:hypothetical protein